MKTKNLFKLWMAVLMIIMSGLSSAQDCNTPLLSDDFNDCIMPPGYFNFNIAGNNQFVVAPQIAGCTVDGSCTLGIASDGNPSLTELQLPGLPPTGGQPIAISFVIATGGAQPGQNAIIKLVLFDGGNPTELMVLPTFSGPGIDTIPIEMVSFTDTFDGDEYLAFVYEDPTGFGGFACIDNFEIGVICDDGDPCTDDYCDPILGICIHIPIWQPLTAQPPSPGSCYMYVGYIVTVNNEVVEQTVDIDVDILGPTILLQQTSGDIVVDGVVVCTYTVTHVWEAAICGDMDPCTDDYCDPETGECVHVPSCDDGDGCT
jgi:hypothetical protein